MVSKLVFELFNYWAYRHYRSPLLQSGWWRPFGVVCSSLWSLGSPHCLHLYRVLPMSDLYTIQLLVCFITLRSMSFAL